MKLYLAVAVLLLALTTRSEAQAVEEPTDIMEQLNQFGERVAELGQDIATRTKATFENAQNSEFATNSKNWFQAQFDLLKEKYAGLGQ